MTIKEINRLIKEKNLDEAREDLLKKITKESINIPILSLYLQKIYEINYHESKLFGSYKKELKLVNFEVISAHVSFMKKIILESQEELDRKIARCLNEF